MLVFYDGNPSPVKHVWEALLYVRDAVLHYEGRNGFSLAHLGWDELRTVWFLSRRAIQIHIFWTNIGQFGGPFRGFVTKYFLKIGIQGFSGPISPILIPSVS